MSVLIAPSILAADFARLGDEIRAVEAAGAEVIHVDVMDGHFVPNLTMGPAIVASIRKITKLPLDCHLMIEDPEKYIGPFAKAGADWISVHQEVCDLAKVLPAIRALGCKAGCVINPPTPAEAILPFLALADFVLVMSVNPGFAGQKMIDACIGKVAVIRRYLDEHHLTTKIEVDGGIAAHNSARVIAAGADVMVAGAAVFDAEDYEAAIAALKR
jgi:ribulose-phosphate 3-epimerase